MKALELLLCGWEQRRQQTHGDGYMGWMNKGTSCSEIQRHEAGAGDDFNAGRPLSVAHLLGW